MIAFSKTLLATASVAIAGHAGAATIANVSAVAYSSAGDLTALGSSDWAYWDENSDTSTASYSPTNEKNSASLIQPITAVSGGNVRGTDSGTATRADFTYTLGTTTASGSVSDVIGVFNTSLNTTGAGVALTVTLPTVDTYRVTVWTAFFGNSPDRGSLTASLTGATSYNNDSLQTSDSTTPKATYVFTFDVTPDTAGDSFTVSNVLKASGGNGSAHALISGAAVSVVPEPSSLALLSLAGLLAFRRRR